MEPILLIPVIFGFFITFILLPFWIKRAKKVGLEGKDINKYDKSKVAEAGGVVVIAGFIIGIFLFIAIRTFVFKSFDMAVEIFALVSSVMILAFVGMIDDILGWRIGLDKKTRLFFCLLAAIPLIVINAGNANVSVPFLDGTNLGLLYPLLIIPLGIIGASTTFNFIAGWNGLEAGQGIIILSGLAFVTFFTGNSWLSLIALCAAFCLLAFLLFNKYPARVFPGDVLTYPIGGLIAIIAILGNIERVALFFFIPYFLEIVLKLRGGLKKQSFGKPNKDNSLDLAYKKLYGIEHIAIIILKKIKKDGKVYEKDVVNFILIAQFMIVLIGILLFRNFIF